jgi:hypothetical protein
MRWKLVLEGTDEFGPTHRSELEIDKNLERLSAGEIGFSVEDGKAIMAHLQQVVVKQQCEAYVLTSRFCTDCKGFRHHPEREFVVSVDTAHVRTSRAEAGRNFEIVVARCGRGGRGSRPGRYFTTADTSKRELQSRTLQALQSEGYMRAAAR